MSCDYMTKDQFKQYLIKKYGSIPETWHALYMAKFNTTYGWGGRSTK